MAGSRGPESCQAPAEGFEEATMPPRREGPTIHERANGLAEREGGGVQAISQAARDAAQRPCGGGPFSAGCQPDSMPAIGGRTGFSPSSVLQ
jgi:hypothetical protein